MSYHGGIGDGTLALKRPSDSGRDSLSGGDAEPGLRPGRAWRPASRLNALAQRGVAVAAVTLVALAAASGARAQSPPRAPQGTPTPAQAPAQPVGSTATPPAPAVEAAAAAAPAPPPVTAAATPSPGGGPTRGSRRVGPSERSTAEIREEAARRPYPLDFGQRLDRSHDWLYVNAQEFVENTDRRFAPADAELLPVPATPFRLGLVTETINRPDGAKFELDLNLDVTLKLPNLERRLRIFITNDDVAESPDRAGERGNLRAGLRFNPASNFDFDVGVRGDLPPIAFASLRWSKFYPVGRWDIYPFGKLFAETDEGLGVSTGLTFDRRLGEQLIGRASSFAKWRKDTAEIEWTQVFLLAHADELLVPERYGRIVRNQDIARGYGMQLLATGERRNRVESYEASVFYKRPLRHRWLYGYVEPLVRWDRKYGWNADPGIRIGIEALFWDLSRSRGDVPSEPILLRPTEDRPALPKAETPPGIAPGPAQ